MVEDKFKKSCEISFFNDFELYKERKFLIWNYRKSKYEQYVIKKTNTDFYTLFLEEKDFDESIFESYGIWSNLTDDQITIITNAIESVRAKILNKYIKK